MRSTRRCGATPVAERRGDRAACLGLAACLAIAPATAAPLAAWAPVDGLDEHTARLHADRIRARCVPARERIALPVYPDAVLMDIAWGRVQPQCIPRDGWTELGGVRLLSRDAPGQVGAWYANELDTHTRYTADQGDLFIATPIADFLWTRDYYKYPNVAIRPAPPAWAAAGYRSLIEFNRPPR